MVGRNVEASNVWFIVDFTAAVCSMLTPKLENGWDHQTKSIESLLDKVVLRIKRFLSMVLEVRHLARCHGIVTVCYPLD